MHPMRLLQMDSVRPGEELAVFQGMPEHRVRQVPFLFGRRPADHRSVVDGRALDGDRARSRTPSSCATCAGPCDVACKMCRYDMEPLLAMRELRAKLVEDGDLPAAYQPMLESLRKNYNMMGEPHEQARRLGEGTRASRISTNDDGQVRLPRRLPLFLRRRAGRSGPIAVKILQEGGRRFRHHGRGRKLLRRTAPSAWAIDERAAIRAPT